MQTYNLFRSKSEGLYCAVPEDCAVPAFLSGDLWEFSGKADQQVGAPAGFNGAAAATGVRFNGFYLFEGFSYL
jgi:hypothetical protein